MVSEYLPALRSIRAPIEAVCEPDQSRERLLSSMGIKRYAKVTDLPGSLRALPAIVAVPHYETPRIVTELLRAGFRRILIEKPPALELAVLQSVSEQIARFEADVFVASKRRFSAAYNSAREVLKTTVTRKFVSIRLHRCFNRDDRSWRASIDKAGEGVLFDLGYHAVDLVHWMTEFDQEYIVESSAPERSDHLLPNWSRAKFRMAFPKQNVVFEVDVDRVAPSPFEQLIIDTGDDQRIFDRRKSLEVNKHTGKSKLEVFQGGNASEDETTQMLSEFVFSKPCQVSAYDVHSLHLQTIETALGRRGVDE